MKIYDISMEIKEGMTVWKNMESKKPDIEITSSIPRKNANESRLHLDSHTGTHVDAPFHFLPSGKKIDSIPLSKFVGECIILDLTKIKNRGIEKKDIIKSDIKENDIVILKTSNKYRKSFDFDFVYLGKTGAKFLALRNVKAVGINALGIEKSQPQHDTHKTLFKKNIPIIEGLELSKVKSGRYTFIGLPLKIKDGDASPIRAVLIEF